MSDQHSSRSQLYLSSDPSNHSSSKTSLDEAPRKELVDRDFEISLDDLLSASALPRIAPLDPSLISNELQHLTQSSDHSTILSRGIEFLHACAEALGLTTATVDEAIYVNPDSRTSPGSTDGREKPDAAKRSVGASGNDWLSFSVPIEAKTDKTIARADSKRQLLRYMRRLSDEHPGCDKIFGLLFSNRRVQLMFYSPAMLCRTPFIDLTDSDAVSQIVNHVYTIAIHRPPFTAQLSRTLYRLHDDTAYRCSAIDLIAVKRSAFGARTAAWAVVDEHRRRCVLKLSWLKPQKIGHEGEMLRLLAEKGVESITQLLDPRKDGVVVRQATASEDAAENFTADATWVGNVAEAQRLRRFRAALLTVDDGYRVLDLSQLGALTSPRQTIWLLAGLMDAAIVVFQAWHLARCHHRDISIGNVAFTPLEDFDMDSVVAQARTADVSDAETLALPSKAKRTPNAIVIDWGQARLEWQAATRSTADVLLEDRADDNVSSDLVSGTLLFSAIDLLKGLADVRAFTDLGRQAGRTSEQITRYLEQTAMNRSEHVPLHDVESLLHLYLWVCGTISKSPIVSSWTRSIDAKSKTFEQPHWLLLCETAFETWDDSMRTILIDLANDLRDLVYVPYKVGSIPARNAGVEDVEAAIEDDTKQYCAKFVRRLRRAIVEIAELANATAHAAGESDNAPARGARGVPTNETGRSGDADDDDDDEDEEDEDDRAGLGAGESSTSRHRFSASQGSPTKRARAG